MKTIIYYFTGTGNSLFAAKKLQSRIPGCEVEPVIKKMREGKVKTEAQTVGFVFPVHMMSAPLPLREFIKKCDLSGADYLFAVATRKGTSHGAFETIDKLLRKKGKKLNAFFNLQMGNNSAKFNYIAPTPEELKTIEASVISETEAISKAVIHRKTSREKDFTANQKYPKIISKLGRLTYIKNENLYADEKCSGCGTCVRVCPANRIARIDGKTGWDENIKCFRCAACINFCPSQAVQIKGFTEGNERYTHPYAAADDISAQK
jgi:ferredoxin